MAVNKGFLYRFLLRVVPVAYDVVSRMLFATCRVRVMGRANMAWCEQSSRPFVGAFWHYSIFNIIELHRNQRRGWSAMVSASDDAEFVARILERKNLVTVRGSRNMGGMRALKELIELVRQGFNAAIVADGSQGPPRVMQPGALLLGSKTGAPILPIAVAADRYWTFRSWDRTMLPKPFSRIVLSYGKPMDIPPKLSAGELENYRKELQGRLNELYRDAWQELGLRGHDGAP